MTMRRGGRDGERGEGIRERDADTRSHTYHLKETFIPHIKGGSRDELSQEKFGLCVSFLHMCVCLC